MRIVGMHSIVSFYLLQNRAVSGLIDGFLCASIISLPAQFSLRRTGA
jgi:hypothetical protein